jgi:hypothetical protein
VRWVRGRLRHARGEYFPYTRLVFTLSSPTEAEAIAAPRPVLALDHARVRMTVNAVKAPAYVLEAAV